MLGPLAGNGGPTLTHLPLPGSPAIDASELSGAGLAYLLGMTPFDQRGEGFPRVFGAGLDIGAVEVSVSTLGADLLISKNGRSWKGDNRTNRSGRGQKLTTRIRKGQTARFYSRLQNDSAVTATFTVRASTHPSPGGVRRKNWEARYFQTKAGGSRNISGALRRGYRVNLGDAEEIRIRSSYRLKRKPGTTVPKSKRARPFRLAARSGGSIDRTISKVIRKK